MTGRCEATEESGQSNPFSSLPAELEFDSSPQGARRRRLPETTFPGAPFLPGDEPRCEIASSLVQGVPQDDPALSAISSLAARVLDTPMGAITFVGHQYSYTKACTGVHQLQTTDRRWSFCTWLMLPARPEALVVEDLSNDARFKSHPLVCQPPHLRCYLGVPLLMSDGCRLGSLCVLDYKPRHFSAECVTLLSNLAELVVQEVECRLLPRPLEPRVHRPAKSICYRPAMLLDLSREGWKVLYHTSGWAGLPNTPGDLDPLAAPPVLGSAASQCNHGNLGSAASQCLRTSQQAAEAATAAAASGIFWDIYTPMGYVCAGESASQEKPWVPYAALAAQGQPFQLVLRQKTQGQTNPFAPSEQLLCLDLRPASTEPVWSDMPPVAISMGHGPPSPGSAPDVSSLYCAVLLNADLSASSSMSMASSEARSSEAGTAAITPGGGGSGMQSELGGRGAVTVSTTPFDGVVLGPVIGTGSFGKVYLARREDEPQPLAVKVIPHGLNGAAQALIERTGEGLEASLGLTLKHPHVIHTLAYALADNVPAAAPAAEQQPLRKRQRMMLERSMQITSSGSGMCTWILLEYCGRGTLQDAIDSGIFRGERDTFSGGVDLAVILEAAAQVADGMAYLHSRDVLHGDLSPNNVMLADLPTAPPASPWLLTTMMPSLPAVRQLSVETEGGGEASQQQQQQDGETGGSMGGGRGVLDFVAKVCDFGLSRTLNNDTTSLLTETYGTPSHMPREMLMQGRMSRAADVYAFGIIMWELYTGQRPFAGCSAIQVVAQKLMGQTQLTFPQGAPPSYADLATRCMAADPAERPPFTSILAQLRDMQRQEAEAAAIATTGSGSDGVGGEGVVVGGGGGPIFPVWGDPMGPQSAALARVESRQKLQQVQDRQGQLATAAVLPGAEPLMSECQQQVLPGAEPLM